MFSTPLNEEFSHKEENDSESGPSPSQTNQVAMDKRQYKPDAPSDTHVVKSADQLKAEKKITTKTTAKSNALPKAKSKTGEPTKAPPATKDEKQKVKQVNKSVATPAVKTNIKNTSKKNSTIASDNKSGKDEL